ncbi:MAG: NADH oxidase [Halobacteriovoraceae bacterium]|nr:NADH oxidase [Halobacteriovoraceae bacterium]|tara:strand:- start:3294 stop:4511 length:1218 start_codon:yes stop_codon:yes gene_type:complete
MTNLNEKLVFKSGRCTKNRIVKAAMSENMGSSHLPDHKFERAYGTWAQGGAGLIITGNVMVDKNHLGENNNVVLDEEVKDLEPFKKWADSVHQEGALVYMQINHPGKQSPKFLNKNPVAPSAVGFQSHLKKAFHTPKALLHHEIESIIEQFITTAQKAEQAGFDGVQVHGAHGYLVSQFLSPLHNQREDLWGGPLENRARFLTRICRGIKENTSADFGVSLKINSADFQKGGFSKEESMTVLKLCDQLNLDFVEVSGGTYEASAMMGHKKRTHQREAYFIDYAEKAKALLQTPLMLTGGFRSARSINQALELSHIDLAGMARPLCVDPDLPKKMILDQEYAFELTEKKLGVKFLDKMIPLEITWYTQQIHRMGAGKAPDPSLSVWKSALDTLIEIGAVGLKRTRA